MPPSVGYVEVFQVEYRSEGAQFFAHTLTDFDSYEAALEYGTFNGMEQFRISKFYKKMKEAR